MIGIHALHFGPKACGTPKASKLEGTLSGNDPQDSSKTATLAKKISVAVTSKILRPSAISGWNTDGSPDQFHDDLPEQIFVQLPGQVTSIPRHEILSYMVDLDNPIDLGSNICLEPRRAEHAAAVYAAIEKNRAHLTPWFPWAEKTKSVDDVLSFYRRGDAKRELGELIEYVIVEHETVIGVIDIHSIERFGRSGRIGYWLVENAQGRGTMTRAVAAVTDVAFLKAGLNRLEIRTAPNNVRSRSIPIRLGYRLECILEEGGVLHERFVDMEQFVMLAKRWKNPLGKQAP
jgi:ribosomal-protein-serine acetyltransferase